MYTDKHHHTNQKPSQTERPTKLALANTTRDIPVHIYTRRSTDIKPTTPNKHTTPPEDTELTLVKASDRHVGFTIEFNAGEASPKMSKKDSLQDFVPVTVKNKINENKRIVEELKAERRSKKGEDPDSLQVGSRKILTFCPRKIPCRTLPVTVKNKINENEDPDSLQVG